MALGSKRREIISGTDSVSPVIVIQIYMFPRRQLPHLGHAES